MQNVHIANTDFEFELAKPHTHLPIEQAWASHPLCLQLQFLPLLYIKPEEGILVTSPPDAQFLDHLAQLLSKDRDVFPHFLPLQTHFLFPQASCLSWGASERVKKWAEKHAIYYQIPPIQVVKEINSKAFSFENTPRIAGSALIQNAAELIDWLAQKPGKKVLKTCFGVSGQGHCLIDDKTSILEIQAFCQKEWEAKRVLIGEPWLEKLFDFSTQWNLTPDGKIICLGSTVFETDARGAYRATQVGPEALIFQSFLPFLEEHKRLVEPLLQLIVKKGFFGYLGVDALIYRCSKNELCLYPIVEINGRQTMSLIALHFQKQWFPDQPLRLFFAKTNENHAFLLPKEATDNKGIRHTFKRRLAFTNLKSF